MTCSAPPKLTEDILLIVFSHLKYEKKALLNLLLVNSDISAWSLSLLYHSVTIYELTTIDLFCKAINTHSWAPGPLVKSLSLDLLVPSQNFQLEGVSDDILRDVRSVLTRMTNLRDLSLLGYYITGALSQLHAPFQLDSISLSSFESPSIVDFLHQQSPVTRLELNEQLGGFPRQISSSWLLPKLSTLVSCETELAALAPGRPITCAVMRPCTTPGHAVFEETPQRLISALERTTEPITQLDLDFRGWEGHADRWKFVRDLGSTGITSASENLKITDNMIVSYQLSYLHAIVYLLRSELCFKPVQQPSISRFSTGNLVNIQVA
jgi:hypothetical protein